MPEWLLPNKLPAMNIKGRIRHAPMIDARAIAITIYNRNRKLRQLLPKL